MDSLENIIQKIMQLSMSTKEVEDYQIYGEKRDTAYLTSELDSRSRWMGEIKKREGTTIDVVWTVVLSKNRLAKASYFAGVVARALRQFSRRSLRTFSSDETFP